MKKVLINKPIHQDAIKRLSEEVEVLMPFKASPAEITKMLPDIEGMILCAGMKMLADEITLAEKLELTANSKGTPAVLETNSNQVSVNTVRT